VGKDFPEQTQFWKKKIFQFYVIKHGEWYSFWPKTCDGAKGMIELPRASARGRVSFLN